MLQKQQPKDMAELLWWQRRIPSDKMRLAQELRRKTGMDLGSILVDLKAADHRTIAEARAFMLGIPYVDLSRKCGDAATMRRLPLDLMRKFSIIPIERTLANRMLYATANPHAAHMVTGRFEQIIQMKAETGI